MKGKNKVMIQVKDFFLEQVIWWKSEKSEKILVCGDCFGQTYHIGTGN